MDKEYQILSTHFEVMEPANLLAASTIENLIDAFHSLRGLYLKKAN